MKATYALAFTVLSLAGCTATGDALAPPVPSVGVNEPAQPAENEAVDNAAPVLTAAGTSPIPAGKQVAFCQDQVAFMNGADMQSATTGDRVVAPDGSISIDVTVDKAGEGLKTLKCRLDANGRFVDVVSPTNDASVLR